MSPSHFDVIASQKCCSFESVPVDRLLLWKRLSPYFEVRSPVGKIPWKASPMMIPNLIAIAVLHQFNRDLLFDELTCSILKKRSRR